MESQGSDIPEVGAGNRSSSGAATGDLAASARPGVDRFFDTVLANAPVAALILDRALKVRLTNQAFDEQWGATVGRTLDEALPDLADALAPLVEEALSDGVAADRVELRSAMPGGAGRRYWQVSVFPLETNPDSNETPLLDERMGVGLFLSDVTEERRIARRLVDSLARVEVTLEAGGLGTWDWDLLRGEARWGPRSLAAFGLNPDRFDERPESFLEAVHPDDRQEIGSRILDAARSAGQFRAEVRVNRDDSEIQWVEVRGKVVLAANGTPRRMVGVLADVTQRRLVEEIKAGMLEREHAARVASEAARDRLSLVAEVGADLMGKLDSREVLAAVPPLLVPRVAEWCAVDLIDPAGTTTEVASLHADPESRGDVRALRRWRLDGRGDRLWSIRRAISTGESELIQDITDDDLAAGADSPEDLAVLRRLAPSSAIAVPLLSGGEVLGGVTVVTGAEGGFELDDLTLIEAVCGRVALAMENARLFESRAQVTRALQQTLLPPSLPVIPGAEMAVRYRVAADGIDIGGDFYDTFPVADGAWAVVIGDVCGKGAEAAAVTGLFRHTVRAFAVAETSPARILRSTNDAILGQIDDTRFCTAVLMTVTPDADGALVTLACGGHPRPIVVRASGEVERVDVNGTLLGVFPEPVLEEVQLTLTGGDALVLYTDGVTEARSGSEQFGEERLVDALAAAMTQGVTDANGLATQIERAVDKFQDGQPGDDLAIVILRISPEDRSARTPSTPRLFE